MPVIPEFNSLKQEIAMAWDQPRLYYETLLKSLKNNNAGTVKKLMPSWIAYERIYVWQECSLPLVIRLFRAMLIDSLAVIVALGWSKGYW